MGGIRSVNKDLGLAALSFLGRKASKLTGKAGERTRFGFERVDGDVNVHCIGDDVGGTHFSHGRVEVLGLGGRERWKGKLR